MTRPTITFLGESPPAGAPAGFVPFDCASGTRLATTLGLKDRARVTAGLYPVNLFNEARGVKGAPPWDATEAADAANVLARGLPNGSVIVALGDRVRQALRPTRSRGQVRVLDLPHPSGASPTLNRKSAQRDARRVVLPSLLALGRHASADMFRLDDEAVLLDVATALMPDDPAQAMVLLPTLGLSEALSNVRDLVGMLKGARVPARATSEAARRRREQLYAPGCDPVGDDRLYVHWCQSERDRCARAVYEAEANDTFDRPARLAGLRP